MWSKDIFIKLIVIIIISENTMSINGIVIFIIILQY